MTNNNDWQKLQDDIEEFTTAVFKEATVKTKMLHLKEEIDEVIAKPKDKHEWADCLILLLDAARIAGLNTEDLLISANEKMAINKKRNWGEPDKSSIVRHI